MSDWIHALPLGWMAAAIYWLVMSLAVGELAQGFKGASPGER
jgi:hypothetical protein